MCFINSVSRSSSLCSPTLDLGCTEPFEGLTSEARSRGTVSVPVAESQVIPVPEVRSPPPPNTATPPALLPLDTTFRALHMFFGIRYEERKGSQRAEDEL